MVYINSLNAAQWFMAIQALTCLGGALGFLWDGKPWTASIWTFYSLGNVGWYMVAGGKV